MQTLDQPTPTGAVYGTRGSRETRVEQLPAIDVKRLVGVLLSDWVGPTEVTPLHGWLVGSLANWWPDLLAYRRSGALLVAEAKVFEPTPSAIEQTRASVWTVIPDTPRDPSAYEAFKALGRWLDADDAAIADMVGVGRTTPYTWKRDGREPRPATTQRIYEYEATIDSLRRRLGIAGLRRWLREGVPSRRDTLLAGHIQRLERDVHAVLFRRAAAERIDLAASPEESAAPATTTTGERPLRPSGRRPRRSSG
jgi:hypothetical protein